MTSRRSPRRTAVCLALCNGDFSRAYSRQMSESTEEHGAARTARLATITGHDLLLRVMNVQGYLLVWADALERQAERVRSSSFPPQSAEMWLNASALGSALRCVRLAQGLGANLSSAESDFQTVVPHGKKVRDVLEHLEDYEWGVGRSQKPGDQPLAFMTQRRGGGPTVDILHLQGVGLELNFETTQKAVSVLIEAAMEALQQRRAGLEREFGPWQPPPRPDLAVRRPTP